MIILIREMICRVFFFFSFISVAVRAQSMTSFETSLLPSREESLRRSSDFPLPSIESRSSIQVSNSTYNEQSSVLVEEIDEKLEPKKEGKKEEEGSTYLLPSSAPILALPFANSNLSISRNISHSIGSTNSATAVAKRNLFGTFIFKGFGIAFLKSLNSFQSGGFRVAIPFTQNFPEYARRTHLPRIVLQTAILYPHEYRLSIVFSVPANMALYGLSKAFERTSLTNKEISRRIRKRKASDSVRRVGISISIGYLYKVRTVRYAFGPWMFYLPGANFKSKVLASPFIVYEFLSNLIAVLMSICWRKDTLQVAPLQHNSMGLPSSMSSNSTVFRNSSMPLAVGASTSSKVEHKIKKKEVPSGLLASCSAYFSTKSPGVGYNVGWTRAGNHDAIGSTLLFEMEPFYPLGRQLLMIKSWYDSHMSRRRVDSSSSSKVSGRSTTLLTAGGSITDEGNSNFRNQSIYSVEGDQIARDNRENSRPQVIEQLCSTDSSS